MIRKSLRNKGLLALVLPLFVFGVALAGGPDCDKGARAVHAGEKGAHCHLSTSKDIAKTARMTDKGAVVVFAGKTEKAVEVVKAHLSGHEKGAETACADCPMGMDGVETTITLNDEGGEVTFVASDKKTIKMVQKWAEKPAACCDKAEKADKV